MDSGAMNGTDSHKALTEAEKDNKIAQLLDENQQLVARNTELEDLIEMYKIKMESLEEQMYEIRKVNTALGEKLDSASKTPAIINRGYSDGDLDEALIKKNKKPLPVVPAMVPTGVSNWHPTPNPNPNPSSGSSGSSSGSGMWASATASRRSETVSLSGRTTRSSMMFSKEMGSPLSFLNASSPPVSPSIQQSPSTPDTPSSTTPPSYNPMSPTDQSDLEKLADTRDERAKTSPIPGPSPNIVPPLNRSVTSSFLGGEEEEEEQSDSPDLVLATNEETGKVMVKGGTLEKLIERLSYEKSPDADFVAAFLLTYRSFTTQAELLDKLIQRYNLPPKDGLSAEEEANFTKKRKIIRLRVGNTLKMWVDKHLHDFEKDAELVQKLSDFVDNQLLVDLEAQGKIIKKLLFNERQAVASFSFTEDPPVPIAPKSKDTFKDFDPLEVARQLTLIEADLYRSIQTKECLNQSWNKPEKDERAPHIVAMIKRFNLVSVWVATEIVKTEKLDHRVTVLKKFITIAEKCREIGNFNAIMEILAGLQNSAIYRLKKTWEKVFHKSNYEETYNNLLALMNNKGNFKDYRAALHKCHPPCIPYLGVYLTDLTFIEDGMKNTLNGRDELINFEKRRKLSGVIHEIQQYQQTPYNFIREETIRNHVFNIEGLTEKALYKYSLICEPREAKTSMDSSKKEFALPSFLSFRS